MPYCCQCGTQVGAADRYCVKCGTAQAAAPPHTGGSAAAGFPPADISSFWNRNASLLCYIPWFGWIAAVVVLATDRFRRDFEVRFHAFQGLYLFVAWLLVDWVVSPVMRMSGYGFWEPMPHVGGGVLHLLILAGWIVMIVKVRHHEHYRLPVLGDLAERSVAEQRAG